MQNREMKTHGTDAYGRKKMLLSPKVGCVVMILFVFVLPIVVLSWYPLRWRILLSRLDDGDENACLATIRDMREYPAKNILPVFFRTWATTGSKRIAQEVEPDLMRPLKSLTKGLGQEYFLAIIPEEEREDFAASVELLYGTGNPDQRRRALFTFYILRGGYAEETLLTALEDESMPVRHVARLCLTDIGDYELLEKVLESLRAEKAEVIQYSRIAVLGRGFEQMLPFLVSKLGAKAAVDRQHAIEMLQMLTGKTLGFRADDPPEVRETAIRKWREFIEEKEGKKKPPK
ncbi:MAG: HEAT repeat domain-containing protein [Planctomycetota bacterium]|jgi:hypothetical protein